MYIKSLLNDSSFMNTHKRPTNGHIWQLIDKKLAMWLVSNFKHRPLNSIKNGFSQLMWITMANQGYVSQMVWELIIQIF